MWSPLVDEAMFWAVTRILTDPARTLTRPGRAVWLLSWLARCGKCGAQLNSISRPGPNGGRVQIYRCAQHGCVVVMQPELDEYVQAVLMAWVGPAAGVCHAGQGHRRHRPAGRARSRRGAAVAGGVGAVAAGRRGRPGHPRVIRPGRTRPVGADRAGRSPCCRGGDAAVAGSPGLLAQHPAPPLHLTQQLLQSGHRGVGDGVIQAHAVAGQPGGKRVEVGRLAHHEHPQLGRGVQRGTQQQGAQGSGFAAAGTAPEQPASPESTAR
jgi:hypothetical protein